jgi:2-polyprenyl-6-methoxyphenol hydroxylase-like FAD-dependent oxidoreductase
MENRNVLISGASIAGPALAYWLHCHGFKPTVVERAPALRRGGQAIDVRGAALEVAERMGILADVRKARTGMRGMSFVDASGNELMSTTAETLTGGPTDSLDVELMRDDLTDILYEVTRRDTEYLFNDSITGIAQGEHAVEVTFERGGSRTFDLVIGADGLHSNVRSLVFGEESGFISHLGIYLAVFTVPNYLGLDRWQTFHRYADGMVGIYSARQNAEARAMLGFGGAAVAFDHRDAEQQKRLVSARMADAGWEAPRLLEAMWKAPDFHFDSMSQIHLPCWSKGRTALIGDAGYCSSPLSGQGTSLALVGAYVLAGELKAAAGEHRTAFARYEERMREFVAQNQRLAMESQEGPPPRESVVRAANAITLESYAG